VHEHDRLAGSGIAIEELLAVACLHVSVHRDLRRGTPPIKALPAARSMIRQVMRGTALTR
jgi:hypothetical protein